MSIIYLHPADETKPIAGLFPIPAMLVLVELILSPPSPGAQINGSKSNVHEVRLWMIDITIHWHNG
jgi:hypothetical protein